MGDSATDNLDDTKKETLAHRIVRKGLTTTLDGEPITRKAYVEELSQRTELLDNLEKDLKNPDTARIHELKFGKNSEEVLGPDGKIDGEDYFRNHVHEINTNIARGDRDSPAQELIEKFSKLQGFSEKEIVAFAADRELAVKMGMDKAVKQPDLTVEEPSQTSLKKSPIALSREYKDAAGTLNENNAQKNIEENGCDCNIMDMIKKDPSQFLHNGQKTLTGEEIDKLINDSNEKHGLVAPQ